MGKKRTFTTLAAASVAAAFAVAPAAAADGTPEIRSAQNCAFGGTWVVTGNWDGVGGDGIGIVVAAGGVLNWYLRDAPNGGQADYVFSYGLSSDRPVVGNWDGIGGDGPGIVRPVKVSESFSDWQWHLRNAPTAGGTANYVFTYGRATVDGAIAYVPVTGNWDGVGGDGPGVAGGNASGYKAWHLRNGPSGGNPDYSFTYGLATDRPLSGNWDGAGGDSPGVRRTTSDGQIWWHERNTTTSGPADIVFNYGTSQDCTVVGNWDGIGGDGPGVVRVNPQTGRLQWHLRNANNPGPAEAVFDYS
ncbi:hypothetical protein [Amycolatopsis solani]|uniref:hypothetical protein n=1 Tax=Amycolatopsis solani TaxID=3028615 RepID=UPI0025B0F69A|nr:hypothetical protein [Amycolatopsis sp. MEP2-6]